MFRLRTGRAALVGAIAVGIAAGLVLTSVAIALPHRVVPFRTVVEPAGTHWTLTPPPTWCTRTEVNGGVEYSCSGGGAVWIQLNVSQPSRIAGVLNVDGPSAIWVLPDVWSCELGVRLTGFVHSCPPPYQPPPWGSWTTNFSGTGPIDFSTLPLNVTSDTGVLPPAIWAVVVVDSGPTNETAMLVSPVILHNP